MLEGEHNLSIFLHLNDKSLQIWYDASKRVNHFFGSIIAEFSHQSNIVLGKGFDTVDDLTSDKWRIFFQSKWNYEIAS